MGATGSIKTSREINMMKGRIYQNRWIICIYSGMDSVISPPKLFLSMVIYCALEQFSIYHWIYSSQRPPELCLKFSLQRHANFKALILLNHYDSLKPCFCPTPKIKMVLISQLFYQDQPKQPKTIRVWPKIFTTETFKLQGSAFCKITMTYWLLVLAKLLTRLF